MENNRSRSNNSAANNRFEQLINKILLLANKIDHAKNRIRLGISGVSDRLKSNNLQRPLSVFEVSCNKIQPFPARTFVVSASDLDEMFDANLKVLEKIEKDELSSNASSQQSRRYNSTLDVYISPKENRRHSSGVYYGHCKIVPYVTNPSGNQNKSNQLMKCSSYETLYDNFKSDSKSEERDRHWESMSQSMMNGVLNFKVNHSDSDKTLKSLCSDDTSSSISSLGSQEFQSNNTTNILNNLLNFPKLRQISKDNNGRPSSCYVDTKFGQYSSSNKTLYQSNAVFNYRPDIRDRSNVVISRPLGNYPSRTSSSYLSISTPSSKNTNDSENRLSIESNSNKFFPISKKKVVPQQNNKDLPPSNILNHHLKKENTNKYNKSNSSYNPHQYPMSEQSVNYQDGNNNEFILKNKPNHSTIEENNRRMYVAVNANGHSGKSHQNISDLSLQTRENGRTPNSVISDSRSVSTSQFYQIRRIKKT